MQECDLLLVGTCTSVEPGSPEKGYTRYSFSVEKDLAGVYQDKEIAFSLPRASATAEDYTFSVGMDEYEVGQKYILPISRDVVLFDWVYYGPNAGLNLNLSRQEYTLYGENLQIPSGKSIEEYASDSYHMVVHEEKTLPLSSYGSEFEEFWAESQLIGRMKVEKIITNSNLQSTRCSIIELIKGNPSDVYSITEGGLIIISVLKDYPIEIGKEYLIGFNPVQPGSAIYTMSTKTSVKELDEELIQQLRTREE